MGDLWSAQRLIYKPETSRLFLVPLLVLIQTCRPRIISPYSSHLEQEFSSLARLIFWTAWFFVWGDVLCVVAHLAASMASPHEWPVAPPQLWQPNVSLDVAKCPLRQNHFTWKTAGQVLDHLTQAYTPFWKWLWAIPAK